MSNLRLIIVRCEVFLGREAAWALAKKPLREGLDCWSGCWALLDVDISDFVLIGVAVSSCLEFDSGFNFFPCKFNDVL